MPFLKVNFMYFKRTLRDNYVLLGAFFVFKKENVLISYH